jgi:chromosomal replication initiation ATPase DnaA
LFEDDLCRARPSGPLLEREQVLDELSGPIAATRAGLYSVLFVLGGPGLGKTSVLAQACAAAAGASMGWAEEVASETALPFTAHV